MTNWRIFQGTGVPHDGIEHLPPPPSWRTFGSSADHAPAGPEYSQRAEGNERAKGEESLQRRLGVNARGAQFQASDKVIDLVNAALYLRRPLFITGKPGSGKSALAYAVSQELKLGPVLHWMISTRVTLQDGLYHYDAIGRLQDTSLYTQKVIDVAPDIGDYIRLGPLGTALVPAQRPRVLLIDEIDKSDIDLPNDLLNIFEEGEFFIPELARLARVSNAFKNVAVMPYDSNDERDRVIVQGGRVHCTAFPFIVLTSNNERDFPPAFLRRCIRLDMEVPSADELARIVQAHLGQAVLPQAEGLIQNFIARREQGDLATDQLLNAVYLTLNTGIDLEERQDLRAALLRHLSSADPL